MHRLSHTPPPRLDCSQPGCDRRATMVVRSIQALSHPGTPTCTRCAGSVHLRLDTGKGTSTQAAPPDGVLRPRYEHLRRELARAG